MMGAEKRIQLIAKDIIDHFENRIGVMEGKGMVVVMSRRIAVELYEEIIKLRPQWHSDDDHKGFLKAVITGSASDPLPFQAHIRNRKGRELMARRMKDPENELKLAIVRDMWLTGFDVPSLHTMYVDKPMKDHGLMQAIARVNRIYKDKQGGLIVDYIGIAPMLKEALARYADNERNKPTIPQEEAVSLMLESKTDQIAIVVAHRGERAGREKRCAVLPDPPTLHFVLAVLVQSSARFGSPARRSSGRYNMPKCWPICPSCSR